ncbi:MAG: hypothetical protein R2730_15755 [Chitinophagales bacterium]
MKHSLKTLLIVTTILTALGCEKNSPSTLATDLDTTKSKVFRTLKNAYTNEHYCQIFVPDNWKINDTAQNNTPFIIAPDQFKVYRHFIGNHYSFSEDPSLLQKAKVSYNRTPRIYEISDIIELEIQPSIEKDGYELVKIYPLKKVSNRSEELYHSTYNFPERITTMATEWEDTTHHKILCLIQLIIQPPLFASSGYITTFSYFAEMLYFEGEGFPSFTTNYIHALEQVIWDKNYVQNQYNFAASQTYQWKNQMVVRSKEERSYLNSRDSYLMRQYYDWFDEQVCMGKSLPPSTNTYNYEYDYSSSDLYQPNNNSVDDHYSPLHK